MTRAEEAANKAYPGERCIDTLTKIGFIEGYEQAEKDLALTPSDIEKIVDITFCIIKESSRFLNKENFYGEVLKRFNKTRNDDTILRK